MGDASREVRALAASRDRLLTLPNVVGVGVGFKTVGGRVSDRPSLMVLVEQKLPPEALTSSDVVPRVVDDTETDVIEVGRLVALGYTLAPGERRRARPQAGDRNDPDPRASWRPAPGGVSVGHFRVTTGTLGCRVLYGSRGWPMILSNNHVLANATSGRDRRARRGDPIYQPGPYDGGSHRDRLATLYRYVPLALYRADRGFPGNGRDNLVDAALARPLSPAALDPEILGIGPVEGAGEATLGLEVQKSGRTTGLTRGRVITLHATVRVHYDAGRMGQFTGQVITTAMSEGGDSGSLVLDRDRRAVGLLFAGSSQVTVASPIQTVLDLLSASF